ncbi:hypothetical protein CMI37_35170 [Candidatus Pacearchaeota archaeon]|nr:hypothetical protein [Candidatus Pacearchaeota archaeon]
MDIKNMKVSIGIVIAIVAQAFGVIWYIAQMDSTVRNLDTTVAEMQESQATVDVAILQTDFLNLREKVDKLSYQEQVDLAPIDIAIKELETKVMWMMDDWGPKIDAEQEEFDPSNLEEALDKMESRLDDVETTNALIDNEMRTIMSDHGGFADVLQQINAAGLLPSGEKRTYGGYGQ